MEGEARWQLDTPVITVTSSWAPVGVGGPILPGTLLGGVCTAAAREAAASGLPPASELRTPSSAAHVLAPLLPRGCVGFEGMTVDKDRIEVLKASPAQ